MILYCYFNYNYINMLIVTKTTLLDSLKSILDKIDNLVSTYTWREYQEKTDLLSKWVSDNYPKKVKYYPTEDEKYNLSPKQIDDKKVELDKEYKINLSDYLVKLEEKKKEIWYVDLYSEILWEINEKLPRELSALKNEFPDTDYWINTICGYREIISYSIYLLELK